MSAQLQAVTEQNGVSEVEQSLDVAIEVAVSSIFEAEATAFAAETVSAAALSFIC